MNETSRYIIILLIISIYCSGCNTTQPESENDSPGSVEGRISDIARDTLIAGAAITTNPFTIRVITDSSGYYKITGISRGLYKIIASKTYYNSDSLTVSIEAGKTSVADIKLKQQINNAPNPPEVITPEDSSTGIGTTLTLSWTCTDPDGDSLFFDVYFGKSNPPATIISQNQSRTTYTKSGLDSQSVYYWKVVAKDTRNGVTPGNNWRFTTALKTLPTQGLVAYYPFNGNANDESGNGNNGTVYGAAMTKDRFGNANKAYSFDGVNDYIKASSNSLPTGARTISVWFFASSLLTHPVVLGYGGGYCGESLFLDLNHTETPNSYHMESHCNHNNFYKNYTTAPVNGWYHWIVTTSTTGTKMYINGQEIFSNNYFISGTKVIGKNLAIGACVSLSGIAPYTDGNVGYFKGTLDDIRFFNRALTPTEIQLLYHEGGW